MEKILGSELVTNPKSREILSFVARAVAYHAVIEVVGDGYVVFRVPDNLKDLIAGRVEEEILESVQVVYGREARFE